MSIAGLVRGGGDSQQAYPCKMNLKEKGKAPLELLETWQMAPTWLQVSFLLCLLLYFWPHPFPMIETQVPVKENLLWTKESLGTEKADGHIGLCACLEL